MSKKFKMVKVIWWDACSDDAWIRLIDVISHLTKITTVGYLIHKDKYVVTIARDFDLINIGFSGLIHIPVSGIVKISKLKKVK